MRRARLRNTCQPGWVSTPATVIGVVSTTSAVILAIFLSIGEAPALPTYGTVTYGRVGSVIFPAVIARLSPQAAGGTPSRAAARGRTPTSRRHAACIVAGRVTAARAETAALGWRTRPDRGPARRQRSVRRLRRRGQPRQ